MDGNAAGVCGSYLYRIITERRVFPQLPQFFGNRHVIKVNNALFVREHPKTMTEDAVPDGCQRFIFFGAICCQVLIQLSVQLWT